MMMILKRIFPEKEDRYLGEEWMTLADRFDIPHYYKPNADAQIGEVHILEDRCDACGLCIRICPCSTLLLKDRSKPVKKSGSTVTQVMAMTDEPECVACGACAAICPNDACFVSKQVKMARSLFKTINKGPLSLPRLFNK